MDLRPAVHGRPAATSRERDAARHITQLAAEGGASVAKEFKRRYPDMYAEYRRRCRIGQIRLGDIFVWPADDLAVFNLAAQTAEELVLVDRVGGSLADPAA